MIGRSEVEIGADFLLHHEHHHLGVVVLKGFKALLQLRNLIVGNRLQLPIGHAISVHHDLLWETVVHLKRHLEEVTFGSRISEKLTPIVQAGDLAAGPTPVVQAGDLAVGPYSKLAQST